MAIAMSSWGAGGNYMQWLDGASGCDEMCNDSPMHIENIKITTGDKDNTTTRQNIISYQTTLYGRECSSSFEGECNGCDRDCHWSWSSKDPMQHESEWA